MIHSNKLIYNLQRFQILKTKINPETSANIADAYAYAWYVDLYPIMQNSSLHEDLEEYFAITKEQVEQISHYADKEWQEGRLYNFYEYEDYFNARQQNSNQIDRSTLLCVFKYFYINGGFDVNFWDKLLEPMKHPSEAQSITRKFDKDSIYLI